MIVTIAHVREAQLCAGGAREWFKAHGLSWPHFLAFGIDSSILEATGDEFALKVVEIARRHADGR